MFCPIFFYFHILSHTDENFQADNDTTMGCFECIKMKSQRGGSKINATHSTGVTRALGGVSTMSKKRNAAKKYGQQGAGSSVDTLKSSRETSASSTHSRSHQQQKQQKCPYDANSISSSLTSASNSKVDIKDADGNNNNGHIKQHGMMLKCYNQKISFIK